VRIVIGAPGHSSRLGRPCVVTGPSAPGTLELAQPRQRARSPVASTREKKSGKDRDADEQR